MDEQDSQFPAVSERRVAAVAGAVVTDVGHGHGHGHGSCNWGWIGYEVVVEILADRP